jgi:hypothetical protein
MRRVVAVVFALGLASAVWFAGSAAIAAPAPVVSSIVEGRQGGTNKEVIVVVGNNLTAVNGFNLADTSGVLAGQLTVALKTKNLLVFNLPDGIPAAHYTLRLFYGKGSNGQIAFDIIISNLAVAPGTVQGASLDAALRADLNDCDTLGGRDSAYFLDASHLTGTIDPARYSSIADLTAEAKIGTSAGKVAAGDHDHDSRYILRAGDTMQDAVFSFSGTSQAPIAVTSGAVGSASLISSNTSSGGFGVQGTASSTTGITVGVRGTSASAAGFGLQGDNSSTTGNAVGVAGTTASASGFGVQGTATASGANQTAIGVDGTSAAGLGFGVRGVTTSGTGAGVSGQATSNSGSAYGVYANSASATGTAILATSNGVGVNVSAGTTGIMVNTSAAASASGAIAVFQQNGTNKARIDTNGKGYFNGGTQTSGADFAESVATARPIAEYEPGDVMIVDVKGKRRFDVSSSPNSKLVAGIYATKPGVLARDGDVVGDGKWAETEVPMAIVGIVPCKVCDENGAIEAGDLLVSSSVRGHAMKAPENPAPGTVVGKALAPHAKGKGKVEVLLIGR